MGQVTRDDLASKLRQIQDEVDSTADVAKPAGIAIGTAITVGAIGIAYIVGQRRARRQTTVVEVRRV